MKLIKTETPKEIIFRDIDTDIIVYLENKKNNSHMINLINDKGQIVYHEQFKYSNLKVEGFSKDIINKYKKEPFWCIYTWEGNDLVKFENSDGFIQTDRTKLFSNGLVLN